MSLDCKYKEICSGCQYWGTPYAKQLEIKKKDLQSLLQTHGIQASSSIEVLSVAAAGLRDRADLVYQDGLFGFYEKNSRQVIDIAVCQQFSPALQAWFEEVRAIPFPISKGSLRLRVGPQGQRGLWLDFANVDIKNLLDEKNLFLKLQGLASIEIGQKHKSLVVRDGQLKLQEAAPLVWFQTWVQGRAVDLYCHIGDFTQPSLRANQVIAQVIENWCATVDAQEILEFGSGIGNLSLPALGKDRRLTACEIDREAFASFQHSLKQLAAQPGFGGIEERVDFQLGDFQNKNPQSFQKFDLVLVNPPRSGLKSFLDPLLALEKTAKPKYFIYMSCFPESFAVDSQNLQKAGYRLQETRIVDQFPQTKHYEVLSLWQLT